jgi:hypothetical protein
MRKNIIVKDSDVKVRVEQEYLSLESAEGDQVVGFRHIKAVYLNKALALDIGECYKIMQRVPLYIIDEHGYILARMVEEVQGG